MLMCLQKYYAAAETMADTVKKSGDLKMWVVLNSKPEITNEVNTNQIICRFRICWNILYCRKIQLRVYV